MKHLIFKSSFHKKLTRLLVLIGVFLASINTAWAAYYITGSNGNIGGWGTWKDMTKSSDGMFWYFRAASGNCECKINTAKNYTNALDANARDGGFCDTDLGGNTWDNGGNINYWYNSGSYYILVYVPNTAVNTTNKAKVCASTFLPDAGYETTGNTMKYYSNKAATDQTTSALDRTNGSTTDLGTVTTLYLKGFNSKMWRHGSGNIFGADYQHYYFKVHRTADAAGSTDFTDARNATSYSAGTWNWGSWSSNYSYPTYSVTCNQNLLSGLGSGKYTMSYYFMQNGSKDFRLPSTTSKFNELTWTIAVPAMGTYSCTSDGSGDGSSATPFSVAVGSDLTITVSGTQANTDANSELYVSFDGGTTYTSTTTHTIQNITSSKLSLSIKAKYYNSADNLSGTIHDFGTIYYQGTVTPSLTISSFSQGGETVTAVNSGEFVTINASRQNAGTTNITYQYSTDNSNWTTIGSATSSTTQAWTTPAVTSTTTYYVKASMSYGGNSYSDTKTITVYGKKVIKVKNTNGWSPFYMHRWGGDRPATSFPGDASQISAYGTGQWKQVVLYSSNTSFIFVDGTNNDNKNSDQTYAGVSDGGCYEIASGTGTLALNFTANCPAKPSVSVSAATNRTNNAARINGNISSNGNDNITDYGFYWSKTYTTAADLQAHGTKVQKGTSNYTGGIYQDLSSLTASNTIYYIVYATNGQGTQLSSVESFVVPYKVTISKSTGCNTISPSAGTYYYTGGFDVTATRSNGYTFNAWSKTNGNLSGASTPSTGTNKVTFTPTADNATITATYTETTHTVTLGKSGNGHVEIGGATVTSVSGVGIATASGTITAVPDLGYYFTGWTGDINNGVTLASGTASSTSITIRATADSKNITANFAPIWYLKGDFNSWGETHPLTLASSTSGSVTLTTTSAKLSNQKFKIWNKQTDKYYQKANRSITRAANTANSDWTEGGTSNDMKFTSDVIGNYTFAVTFTSNIPSALTVTYPTAYTVTFGKGTGGNTISATATNPSGAISSGDYVASGATVTFSQTALAGYTFKGWYTTVDGNTSAGVNGSNQLTINGTKTVYAQYTPNTYTVSFDNNGGSGATPGNKTVTYGQAYGTLPVGPTPPGADQFVGWFTDKTGGTQVTSSTIVSTASDHKLWARFESTFTVTVQYKCGADVLRAPTTTHASETSVAAEITAPEILGYSFVNWTGDNATFADATSATTTVNVTSATTVVANYNAVPMVYFKNNLDWDDVYVTFDCAFNGEVPSLSGKPYYKMTRLGQSSDIFYCVIPSTYTENNYEHWAWYIAFDNTGTGYNESKHTGTYAFNSGEFIGRKDFDPRATMFIPYDGDTKSLNGGTTYQTGCWLQYNTNYSAYRVRVNTYVQGSGGSEVQDIELRSDVAGATEFKAKVYLGNANHVYGVMLYKDHMKNTNDIWYTNVNNEANTITSATTSLPWSWQKCEEDWQRCRVKTESLGNYIFTVSFATGRPMVDIEYPVTIGDFRLVYKDLATWNITHDEDWQQISPVFKKKANRVDTASFFVSYGSSPTVELQKCTAINPSTGAETWTKQGDNINISSITKKGVYNFTVIQNNDASSATAAYLGAYSGKYYVRTDVSDGGWNDYKSTANAMTYTEYSMEHGGSSGPYSYYFMRHVDAGSNIKFLVANDYSLCLTDTMIDDTYAHEWIEREANVRFTWNHTNNEIHRAYISGSSYIYDRFLVLEGDDKLFDADGHPLTGTYQVAGLNEYEMNFTDDQNWVYETTVQAKPNERVKLTAKFNDKIQYFYGAEGERTEATTYQLIGGTGSTMYKMRVVYDFKTNRLLAAWLPNGDISDPTPINADVMIIRYHQDDAQQITFSGDGKLTDVKTVYGAMEFNKYRLNNQGEEYPHGNLGISQYERDLFFISFPFDVKLNDVFGFGTYGKHWIIEYYDGKTRAKNGYWKDSPTNWKFVTKAMKDSYTLKANEGYVLALDLDELKPESSVWNYGVENVYLYFPSTAAVEDIQATHKTVEIDTVGYQCTINRNTAQGDRRVKDSHWHLIGVPSYANADHSTSDSWAESKGDLEQTIYYPNIDPAAWTSAAPFVYDWDASSNKFGVLRATSYSFKPMHSYLVQYARDTLEWRQVNTTPAAIAARRAMFAKEPCDFRLELLQDENVIDQAFISMRDDEEVTAEFDFNYDLSKMLYGAFTSKSNIYTFAGNEEVAANCLPFKEETTVVPVGLTVDEEGEYIFSIPDGTSGVGVTLVDNERQIRTNLALTDYMTYLPAGDHNNRFVLEISPIEQIVTGVEMINGENGDASLNGENVTGVCKKLIDGLLYIVKDGKVFDARGARLQ